ncbi:nuclear transport factor 2 family protein [Flavobacteriaceae bacterium AH-315-B10]|nr:nuclear transport factor 2 family protein [Flavobacteriaceae bacterium AH-315-B10]
MKNLILSTIVFGLVSIGCTNKKQDLSMNQVKNQKMEKQDKEEIEKLLMVYKESLNTSNVNKAVNCYTKDGVFMPSGAPTASGEKIKGAYEYVFSKIQLNIEFYIEEITIENTIAFAITTSKGTTLIHATGNTVPEENRELFIFEKENNEWKIARYMFNKMK